MTDERSFKPNTQTFDQAVANCASAPLVTWFLACFDELRQEPRSPLRRVAITAGMAAPIMIFGGLIALFS